MPSRTTTLKLKALQHQFDRLRLQVQQEQQRSARLVSRLRLLEGLCDGLSLACSCQAAQCDSSDRTRQHASQLHELRAVEDDLLALLQATRPALLSAAEASQPQPMEQEQQQMEQEQQLEPQQQEHEEPGVNNALGFETVAPSHDPLALFKAHLSQPLVPHAASLTAADLARMLRETVLEGGVHLHLMQANAGVLAADSCNALAQMWTRYLHVISSVILCGKPDVVEGINLYNLITLQEEPDIIAKAAARCVSLPPHLGLTQQQLQGFAAAAPLFRELLSGVMQEQQQLQAQLSADSSTTASSSTGCRAKDRDLEGHQRSTSRMRALLHKEYILRMAVGSWFIGILSWQQLALACSLSWPYPIRASLLTLEAAKYAEQLQPSFQPPSASPPSSQ